VEMEGPYGQMKMIAGESREAALNSSLR